MNTDDPVLVEHIGAVARLTLNAPASMNAITGAMLDALERALDDAANDPEIRVLILTGAGKAFCAGMDLGEIMAMDASGAARPDLLDRVGKLVQQLSALPKPVIASLNGITVAGGLEIALCADIILAADAARIGDAHANYGLVPGAGGAAILPRVIPHHIAMYLLMTGRTLSAAEMKSYGLVCEVHPAAKLADASLALAKLIAAKSPLGLRRIKEVARASMDMSREDALLHEEATLRMHQNSDDWREGLSAFAEKRAPLFHGR